MSDPFYLHIPQLIERIVERYNLCRPEDNHPHGDYTFDHGHTDCWLLGQLIEHLTNDGEVIDERTNDPETPLTDTEWDDWARERRHNLNERERTGWYSHHETTDTGNTKPGPRRQRRRRLRAVRDERDA